MSDIFNLGEFCKSLNISHNNEGFEYVFDAVREALGNDFMSWSHLVMGCGANVTVVTFKLDGKEVGEVYNWATDKTYWL